MLDLDPLRGGHNYTHTSIGTSARLQGNGDIGGVNIGEFNYAKAKWKGKVSRLGVFLGVMYPLGLGREGTKLRTMGIT